MKFTGERYIPIEQGKIRLEHYHRYAIVQDIVKQKDVLDLACGEGYGSSFMANIAQSVVGVDISEEAVQHASTKYIKSNLNFQQGSATALNFADGTFDVVVSFETIEHLAEQAEMLAEIRRVLRPNGLLIISSPNRPIYSEESGEHNKYHVKELDFNEFNQLLKAQFPAIQYFGQRMLMGSVIQDMAGGQDSFRAWHDNGHDLKPSTGHLVDPVYFLAVCGVAVSDLPKIDSSFIYPENIDLIKHYVGLAKWAKSLEQETEERNALIKHLQAEVSERSAWGLAQEQDLKERATIIEQLQAQVTERTEWAQALEQESNERNALIKELEDETVRRGEWGLRLDAEISKLSSDNAELRALLFTLSKSISWKVTLPFREAGRWVLSPIKQSNRYFKGMLRLSKRCYQKLPLGYKTKAAHRNRLAKHFPKLLLASGSHSSTIPLLVLPTVMQVMPEQYENIIDFAKTLKLPVFKKPIVSVIIPIYGQIDYTLRCLASIAENLPQVAFEVIVVDDCSPDNSFKVLRHVNGINLIQNKKNQGFIRSCNAGAKKAKGQYLHFLNNDTQVTPRWLDELLLTFDQFPGTGFVGSKLIYPDGRLQEAGGIIWQDGSAWNFGRFQDPQLPVYNYAREVDYCSGASIMVPKGLFDELGGFDEHYLPAYCEDSDLGLKIRDKGYRVIYQPLSTVIHYEGITSGTDTSGGIKAYQIDNSKKLFERWGNRLQTHQPNGIDVDDAKDRTAKRRVLVLEHCTLTPNEDAGSVTVFNLILLLREMDFQVTFIPEDNFLYMPEHTTALQRVGVEVLYAPYVTSVEQHVQEFGGRYDLVFLFRPVVAERHLICIRKYCQKAKVLYHTIDLHFLRMSREAELQSDVEKQRQADEMKVRELAIIRGSDASIVHSEAEFDLLHPELPDVNLRVFPLIIDIQGTTKIFKERQDIVFVGGFQHAPNVDAVIYFVTEIMPLLRKRLPGVRFYAVGSKVPVEIQALASQDVIIAGFIEDLNSLLDKMRISVAPLRYGAGIKGKIGTAMAVGLPVVATMLAAEGMSLSDGENIMVVETPEQFADAVVNLYLDEVSWNEISQNSIVFAENAWGAKAAWTIFSSILAELGFNSIQPKRPLSLYRTVLVNN